MRVQLPTHFREWLSGCESPKASLIIFSFAPLWIPLCIYCTIERWRNTPLAKRQFKPIRQKPDMLFTLSVESNTSTMTQSLPSKVVKATKRRLHPRHWFNSKKPPSALDADGLPTSQFLRLPYTIRRRIYSYILADRYIIYLRLKRHGRAGLRLGQSHTLYPSDEGSRVTFSQDGQFHPKDIRRYLDWRDLPYHGCVRLGLPISVFNDNNFDGPLDLALLHTCRQLYLECTPLLYSTNTFNLDRVEDLDYLAQTIPSHGLRLIRFLQIMSWSAVLSRSENLSESRGYAGQRILTAKMSSLRQLWIELQLDRSSTEDKITNLGPLRKLRGLQEFNLTFSEWLCLEPTGQLDKLKEYRDQLIPKVMSPKEPRDIGVEGYDI